LVRQAWLDKWSKGESLDTSNPQAMVLQRWFDQVNSVAVQAQSVMASLGVPVTDTGLNAVFEDAAVDPGAVARNASKLVATMVANGSTESNATEAVNNLLSGNPSKAQSGKDWMKEHGVFSDPQLMSIFDPNIFAAFENYKHRLATKAAQERYLGRDGIMLAKLLQLAADNGEFESEAHRMDVTQNVKDFYDIATGNYNPLDKYPFIEKILGWGVTLTMLSSLGKATLSSIPESAMATLGTPGPEIVGQLQTNIKAFFSEYANDFNKGISYATSLVGISYAREHPNVKLRKEVAELEKEREAIFTNPNSTMEEAEAHNKKVKKLHRKILGRSLLDALGFSDSGYNAQTKFETNSANMKAALHVFSSMIGLRAQTDASRIALLSIAADIVRVRLAALQAIPAADRRRRFETGYDLSNEQGQFLKELQGYGMDVEATLSAIDSLSSQIQAGRDPIDDTMNRVANRLNDIGGETDPKRILKDNFMTTLRNMVDSRVVNPQMANLPKYYHDPRLRIFTAMTRFIAGMTANQLPRLYKHYIAQGNAGMRYQAFAVMMMAVALASMANILKDILSYGDDENPYIKKTSKKIQRAVQGAGLLGRLDQTVEAFSPLYPHKSPDPTKQPIGWAWDAFKSNAPPVSWADRTVRAMYNLANDNPEKGVKGLIRSAPLVGSFPIVADTAAKMVKE